MEVFNTNQLFKFVLVLIVVSICSGARVEFYKEAHFRGEAFIASSSVACTNLPDNFKNVNGSLKTTTCIAVYMFENCAWDGFLVGSDERRLIGLKDKYSTIKSQSFSVASFRDCREEEYSPKVNFQYYEKAYFQGILIPFEDVCGCTNLPAFESESKWRSITTFGNCFHRYSQPNCQGELNTGYETHDSYFEATWQSIKPCHIPKHCKI
ncbi:Gamma-crystallin C [Orchesella cincta]|uniref:Gamma-crystallin C n=1 Tax=Orchesella cincta TaxID=48709 RepID=A0A1D2MKL9_ORCCI|nr:Gamma-crystallin C [Orchesella cincta]